MNKYYSLGTQILYIVFISIIASIVFNQLRSDPLSYIKKQVKVVSDLENLQLNNTGYITSVEKIYMRPQKLTLRFGF